MFRTPAPFAAALLCLLLSNAAIASEAVTTCGMTVSDGVLTGDLDCSAAPGFAVTVTNGGSFDLAGFQLIGTADYSTDYNNPITGGGVQCLGECTITGGTIAGPGEFDGRSSYSIGIYADPHEKGSIVHVANMTISNWSGFGVLARDADATSCNFIGNYYGIVIHHEVTMDDCMLSGNAEGGHFFIGEITNSTFDGNTQGFYVLRRMRFTSSSASNNQYFGYYGLKLRAENSAIENNCFDAYAGCADVVARRRPRLIDTTCATSVNDMTSIDWDVCSGD